MSGKPATVSGGVRGLRAMFENKDEATSPPDRGRSPGKSSSGGGSSNATSPRPLSKVRTSFVTVESKSGQWGLRKDTNGEPAIMKRRTSFSIDEKADPVGTAERKQSIATEAEARKNSAAIVETIPESAIETPSIEEDKQLGGTPPKNESLAKTAMTANANKAEATEPKKVAQSSTNGATGVSTKLKEAPLAKSITDKVSTKNKNNSSSATAPATKTESKPVSKSAKPSAAVKAPKTPTPTSPNRGPSEPEKRLSPHKAGSTKPVNGSDSPPKLRIQASPPRTGFVKPKPRSPTRPVKLPASLMAHTASSGSKTALPTASPPQRQTLSRASGNAQNISAQAGASRSPNRATGTKGLTRNLSTNSKPTNRPSLGPPPNILRKQPSKQTLPKKDAAPADESFLARMMRPTTASASKTSEKGSNTPPKRTTSVRKPVIKDATLKAHEAIKSVTTAKTVKPTTTPKTTTTTPLAKKSEEQKTVAKEEAEPAKVISKKDIKSAAPTAPAPENAPESQTESPKKDVKTEETKVNVPSSEDKPVDESKHIEPTLNEATSEPSTSTVYDEVSVQPEIEQAVVEGEKPQKSEAEKLDVKTEGEKPQAESVAEEVSTKEDDEVSSTKGDSAPKLESSPLPEEIPIPKEDHLTTSESQTPGEGEENGITAPQKDEFIPESLSETSATETLVANQEPEAAQSEEVQKSEIETSEEVPAEDPQDVQAREEIAKLNAEIMGASPVTEVVRKAAKTEEELESY